MRSRVASRRRMKTLVPGEGGDLQLWRSELVNSSFAVALMNTSPEEHVIDVSFPDVFRDMDKYWCEATYTVYDLCEKNGEGGWGRSLGTMSGGIRGVTVATHQTKVWKFVPVQFSATTSQVWKARVAIFIEPDSVSSNRRTTI
ncbi:hypothetical protein BJ322DRAFT_298899 [Thelephora terrestris]|uniref:Alpha galactosidase C-terminal domain-containing protein n=1 Tax=Thelephora terrestris TaxID=56493 RepID=A0A9P6H8P0_9AGAM|nr:hypothetical protein BJ322DRAFT_298899 [Thelephora terrestris]